MRYTLMLLFIPIVLFAQRPMSEKEVIDKSRIDFTKQYIFFAISGLIEIDGHTFRNDTCRSPIIFKATIDGISIVDTTTKVEYTHRACERKGCNVIHLTRNTGVLSVPWQLYMPGRGIQLDNQYNGVLNIHGDE